MGVAKVQHFNYTEVLKRIVLVSGEYGLDIDSPNPLKHTGAAKVLHFKYAEVLKRICSGVWEVRSRHRFTKPLNT